MNKSSDVSVGHQDIPQSTSQLIVPSIFRSHILFTVGDEYLTPSNCCRCIFRDIILSNNSCHFHSARLSWRQAVQPSPLLQFAASRGPRLSVQRSAVNVFLFTILMVVLICRCNRYWL